MLSKALAAAAGNAGEAVYIEDTFSTYLYTGNGTSQSIVNGVDLAAEGGMVWIKNRTGAYNNVVYDTARGTNLSLKTNLTNAQANEAPDGVSAFNSNGFSVNGNGYTENNNTGQNYASWTFRKAPKFFDVVTYTGNGNPMTINHNLGTVPGCMIVKRTDSTGEWKVYHRSTGNGNELVLNSIGSLAATPSWNSTTPTSTSFYVDAPLVTNGATYVAYLFAHDDGGFGADGTDNVISCGSVSHTTSSTITLGYEPQFIIYKRTDDVGSWNMMDTMRSASATGVFAYLSPNYDFGETTNQRGTVTSTGFTFNSGLTNGTYIYIAIRRPMKPPESGTEVYSPVAFTGNSANRTITAGFPVDMVLSKGRNSTLQPALQDRLRGAKKQLLTSETDAESSPTTGLIGFDSNVGVYLDGASGYWNTTYTYIEWMFKRAPGFFDVVCYTGTGVDLTVNHNLGVVPEWVIIKNRSTGSTNWSGAYFVNASQYYDVRINQDIGRSLTTMGPGGPTLISNSATAFGVLGGSTLVNSSGATYVAYLFATYPGVSKVGSYTGTGTTLQINCGFTGGARFVMIKRTDSTGDWYVWDSARGIVAGNDPYLLLNSTAAEVTNTDYVDTYSAGFEISSTAPAAINANGGSFIYLAIA